MVKKTDKAVASNMMDAFLEEALKSAEKEFGKSKCYVAGEHEAHQLVIPVWPISLRWLIESNGWPLSRLTTSGGAKGTFKSTFCFQLITWYLESGGVATHLDTENKTSSSLMRSIVPAKYFDPEDPAHARFQFRVATTINEWQRMLSQQFDILQEIAKKMMKKPVFPVLWTVDSLQGSGSEESIEHIETEGDARGRGYSDASILITNFLETFPNMLLDWPVTLHMSNHEKPAIGHVGTSRRGGKAPGFYSTLDIQFKRGGESALTKTQSDINRATWQGRNVTLTIKKSSMGSDIGKTMVVPFCWKFETDQVTGLERQVSWWDWSSTTAMVLKEQERELKDVMDVNCVRKQNVGMVFWSDALGVTETSALPAQQFGLMVESDPEWRAKIESALHVQQHPILTPETAL